MDEAIISGYSVSLVLRPEVEMANGFFKLIDELMTVLKGGTDAVLKKLDDLVKVIKKWFDELLQSRKIDWMSTTFLHFGNDGKTIRNLIKLQKRADDGWFNVLAHGDAKHIIWQEIQTTGICQYAEGTRI